MLEAIQAQAHQPRCKLGSAQVAFRAGIKRTRPSVPLGSDGSGFGVCLDQTVNACWETAGTRRFCGGGPPPDAKDLVAGICLSVVQDEEQVAAILNQDWVETWHGWAAFTSDGSDAVAMTVAQRLLQLAGANVPVKMMTNARRLQQLAGQGLNLKVASSHGVNNCLIDSLLLGMMLKGLSPRSRLEPQGCIVAWCEQLPH
eukprot:s569_g19.t2